MIHNPRWKATFQVPPTRCGLNPQCLENIVFNGGAPAQSVAHHYSDLCQCCKASIVVQRPNLYRDWSWKSMRNHPPRCETSNGGDANKLCVCDLCHKSANHTSWPMYTLRTIPSNVSGCVARGEEMTCVTSRPATGGQRRREEKRGCDELPLHGRPAQNNTHIGKGKREGNYEQDSSTGRPRRLSRRRW